MNQISHMNHVHKAKRTVPAVSFTFHWQAEIFLYPLKKGLIAIQAYQNRMMECLKCTESHNDNYIENTIYYTE